MNIDKVIRVEIKFFDDKDFVIYHHISTKTEEVVDASALLSHAYHHTIPWIRKALEKTEKPFKPSKNYKRKLQKGINALEKIKLNSLEILSLLKGKTK